MHPKPVVFLGPSLARSEAEQILDADYRPPVAQGDVVRALQDSPSVIVIIDGFFELVPAVWHKEILLALERGVPVYGAASMGALRAAELHTFGMVGVGQVFEWFRDGVLIDDDEVAVVHGAAEDGYRSLSDAMVDLRAALADAERALVLTPDEAQQLAAVAKALPYPERSLPGLQRAATGEVAPGALAGFVEHARAEGPWQKHRDACEVLAVVAAALDDDALVEPTMPEPLARTVFLEMLVNEAMQQGIHQPTADLHDVALPEPLAVSEKKVLLRLLVRREAERRGLAVSEADMQQSADHFRIEHGFLEVEDFHAWFGAAGLDDAAFVRFLEDRCLAEMVQRLMHHEIQRELVDQVRLSTAQPWATAHGLHDGEH